MENELINLLANEIVEKLKGKIFNIEKDMKYKIHVSYWDSKKNYMVQVADIMCNTIWNISQSPKASKVFKHLNKGKRLCIYNLHKIN